MNLMEVVNQAAALPNDAEHVAFFDQVFANQPELRPQLEQLLGYLLQVKLTNQDNVAQQPPTLPEGSATSDYAPKISVGSVIAGKYKVRQMLGEGGMGTVYIVDTIRDVKTSFALKLIKSEYASHQVIARFEQERQALALMNHPNIAKFIDAGTSETGQPYFVMEHIKGLSITTFCDQEKLTVEERLTLFQSVCHAVQHAHMKGIIHRDLKPGNILVTYIDGKPVPKVIDFGVAKATLQPLTDKTIHSEINSIIGTLEYMAPEQAEVNSLDIDTRADIYALGVILYELLTGALPFSRKELVGVALLRMLEIIRLEEPAKPSTKLSNSGSLPSIAATRKIAPVLLMKKLRGEIDWIIMKCLEKERGRRYQGPNQLAQDIDNYLHDLPLIASPPSKTYRLKKFLRRHRGKVLTGLLLATVLITGTIGTTWNMYRALQAEKAAALEAQIAKAVQSFVEDDLLNQADVEEQVKANQFVDKDIKLSYLLDRTSERLLKGQFQEQPLIQASLDQTVAKAYLALGLSKQARPHLERSLKTRTQLLGANNIETLGTRLHWARYQLKLSDYQQADDTLKALLQDAGANADSPIELIERIKMTRASVLSYLAKYPEAETLYRQIYEARQSRLTNNNVLTMQAGQQLAAVYRLQGNQQKAEELLTSILTLERTNLGNENPSTLRTIQALVSLLVSKQEFSRAEPYAVEAVGIGKKLYHYEHPVMMILYNDLATVQVRLQKQSDAISTFTMLTQLATAKYGEDHANTLSYALNWASCLFLDKQYDAAAAMFRKLQPLIVKRYGTDHGEYRSVLRSLAKVSETTNQLNEAEQYWDQLLLNSRVSKTAQKQSQFIDVLSCSKCKLRLRKFEALKELIAEADSLGKPSGLQAYHSALLLRLRAELALHTSNKREAKQMLAEAAALLKEDKKNNPNRYNENPFAKEEYMTIMQALKNWTSTHGPDLEIQALMKDD